MPAGHSSSLYSSKSSNSRLGFQQHGGSKLKPQSVTNPTLKWNGSSYTSLGVCWGCNTLMACGNSETNQTPKIFILSHN